MNVRREAIEKQEAFHVPALSLRYGICVATSIVCCSRIMKLVSASDRSGRSQNGLFPRRNFAVTEIDKMLGHLDFSRQDSNHFRAINGLREIHESTTLGVELLTGFNKASDGRSHGG